MPRIPLLSVAVGVGATTGTPVHIGRIKPPFMIYTQGGYTTATASVLGAPGSPGPGNEPAAGDFIALFGTNTTTADVTDITTQATGAVFMVDTPVGWIRADSAGTVATATLKVVLESNI